MEERKDAFTPSSAYKERKPPIVLISQLMHVTANMQHVDEVFFWLARKLVESFDISVVQFFAIDETGHARVRASASNTPLIPQPLVTSHQVISVIERFLQERRSIPPLPLENIFPRTQVSQFAQYNLCYWTGNFLAHDKFLVPGKAKAGVESKSNELDFMISLFTPLPLSTEQVRMINFILPQAMRIIVSRGLLLTQASAREKAPALPVLPEIIPQRLQNIEQYQADNPFASTSIISDKNARRLYAAIDGHKNVAELAQVVRLGQKETTEALRFLFEQQKIQLFTAERVPLKHSPFGPSSA